LAKLPLIGRPPVNGSELPAGLAAQLASEPGMPEPGIAAALKQVPPG
jgi:hypothetical protein